MTSPARIAANRRNAQKSTGPSSAGGKAAASRNALRHGLTARQIVCYGERESDFIAFHTELYAVLAPADAIEEELVERIILHTWRLRRTAQAERGVIDYEATVTPQLTYHETRISRAFLRSGDEMTTLSRYEAALDRALGRAYAMLERRQAARRGEHVPAPVTVLIEGIDSESPNPLTQRTKIENYETNPMPPDDAETSR
jgi:hypothetical protein